MFKDTITYVDYDGVERTETFYFNLNTSELAKFQASIPGGLDNRLKEISDSKDMRAMMRFFNEVIMKSYGEKSPDGRRFMKGDNDELAKAFVETPAYDIFFQKIFMSNGYMVNFITEIMPPEYREKMRSGLESYLKEKSLPDGA